MQVVGPAELEPSLQRPPDAEPLDDRRGHRQPEQAEPEHERQHEQPQQHGAGRKTIRPAANAIEVAPRDRRPSAEHRRADERRRQRGREHPDESRLHGDGEAGRDLVERSDRQAEQERPPEPPPVEVDRLGDELPDRSRLRRQGRRAAAPSAPRLLIST